MIQLCKTKTRKPTFYMFFIPILCGFLLSCTSNAYECLDKGGMMNDNGNCVCDGYGKVGQCLSFTQRKTLVDVDGHELYFHTTGKLRGLSIDGKSLDAKFVENDQGLSLYTDDPKIAIFLPRTVAVNKAHFVEGNCNFVLNRKVIREPRYRRFAGENVKVKSPIDFSVESICDNNLVNSYTITDALDLRDLRLEDGREFSLKIED